MVIDDGKGEPIPVGYTWRERAAPRSPAPPRRGRRRLREGGRSAWTFALPLLLVVPLATGVAVAATGMDRTRVRQVARAYADGWEHGSLDGVVGSAIAQEVTAATRQLHAVPDGHPTTVTMLDDTVVTGDRARTGLAVSWRLADGTVWAYRTALQLAKVSNRWQVQWSPQAVHPQLQPGTQLVAAALVPARAQILGAGGRALVSRREVVRVTIRQSDLTLAIFGRFNFVGRLEVEHAANALKVDPDLLWTRIQAAPADQPVTVRELSVPAWNRLDDRYIRSIQGVHVAFSTVQDTAAHALIGEYSTGPGNRAAGISGLQEQYDGWLAGLPGLTITIRPDRDSQLTQPDVTLYHRPPVPGRAVLTTLATGVQSAADAAVAHAAGPAALVAVDVTTGHVLAVAGAGVPGAPGDPALLDRSAPGMTFTIATALAMLDDGLPLTGSTRCPASYTTAGATFVNTDRTGHGDVPFSTAFALGCATTFLAQADQIDPGTLSEAARRLGYGAPQSLGTPTFTGSVPVRADPVGHAAALIGEGPVLAGPLAMAVATATVADGRYTPPRLVLSPAPSGGREGAPLDPFAADRLRALLRDVVTSGTGAALNGVAGGPVAGQTGVAPAPSGVAGVTQWFAGYQGHVAFAVLVRTGLPSAPTTASAAVAVARHFLIELHAITT